MAGFSSYQGSVFWYLALISYINIYNTDVCVVRLAKGCKVLSTASVHKISTFLTYLVLCSLVTPDHNTSPDQCPFQTQIRALIPYGERSIINSGYECLCQFCYPVTVDHLSLSTQRKLLSFLVACVNSKINNVVLEL